MGGPLQHWGPLRHLPSWVQRGVPRALLPPSPSTAETTRAKNLPWSKSEGRAHGHLGSLLPPQVSNLVFAERCHQCLQETLSSSSLSRFRNLCVWCFFFLFKGLFFFFFPSGCVRLVAWRQASYSSLSLSVQISSLSLSLSFIPPSPEPTSHQAITLKRPEREELHSPGPKHPPTPQRGRRGNNALVTMLLVWVTGVKGAVEGRDPKCLHEMLGELVYSRRIPRFFLTRTGAGVPAAVPVTRHGEL